jgi:hypothetical protein
VLATSAGYQRCLHPITVTKVEPVLCFRLSLKSGEPVKLTYPIRLKSQQKPALEWARALLKVYPRAWDIFWALGASLCHVVGSKKTHPYSEEGRHQCHKAAGFNLVRCLVAGLRLSELNLAR